MSSPKSPKALILEFRKSVKHKAELIEHEEKTNLETDAGAEAVINKYPSAKAKAEDTCINNKYFVKPDENQDMRNLTYIKL